MATPSALPDHGSGWESQRFEHIIDGLEVDAEVDVYPLFDVMPHEVAPGSGCWCSPASEFPDGACIIYIHHSLDGRELTERG